MRRRWFWPAWLSVVLLFPACAEPPTKEMSQAQSAIDAAQAAGADRLAADEYHVAVEALKQSNAAVADHDYRLALNHALESREHAQNAARVAADTTTQLRADVERTLAEVATPLAEAHTRLTVAEKSHMQRRQVRDAASALAAIDATVQKAGEAVKAGDYGLAQKALKDVKARLAKATAELNAVIQPQRAHRRS
jgi:hypothetical protein